MSLVKFLTSKVFVKQLVLAVVVVIVLCFLVLKWLNISTNHGEFKSVPDLTGKSLGVAQIELEQETLTLEIQDSANYNPDYPKYSVIEQEPKAGSQVKEDRKIYITLNPSGYRKIAVPDLRQRTFRQAKPTLEALGFKIGKTTYIDNIGKDMVLGLRFEGNPIAPGEQLSKTSTIDFVLGNGNGN
ncbi:PASTA domain-containing protein [Bizionia gelidisalsuginis]|uniref:PASTA domain-containing protein n=1 Tax=Bizionia gelidisalsuginis TaxID=291188 RepID=A0ABY3MCV6_9FLAO|nr:PASTA domain-containing protein [Bizionia gelidisalsuginis]TYC16219.1 PASTA domain-containing protein [Bizionia gelidisalsuginis]